MKSFAILLLVVATVAVIATRRPTAEIVRLQGQAMGCHWSLAHQGHVSANVRSEVAHELERWEQVMSHWREDSDLSRFNRGEPASEDLARVIEHAKRLRAATGSAFDFEVLGKVGEAGFGPGGEGMDLSAIGKGFAVDRVGDRLRSIGIEQFVFELGGEVLAGDGAWKVALESPYLDGTPEVIELSGRAVATSGNYQQFRSSAQGMVSHIIDPRTGDPVVRPACSVTVFAEACSVADAWATALFVLGPDARPDGAPEFVWHFDR